MVENCYVRGVLYTIEFVRVNDSGTKVLFKRMDLGVVFSVECNSFWGKELVGARGLRHEIEWERKSEVLSSSVGLEDFRRSF